MYSVQGAYDARGKPTGFHTSRNSKFELTKILGYTIENPNRRSWGHTFLKKPREWLGLSLYTWKFWRKQSFTPRYFRKLCYTPQKFQSNKFNIIFLITPGNSISFLIDLWISHMLFLQYSWKLHFANPPVWIFFWSSPFEHLLRLDSNWLKIWWLK